MSGKSYTDWLRLVLSLLLLFIILFVVNNYNHFDLIDSSFWIVSMKINPHIIVDSLIDKNNLIHKITVIL